MIKGKKQTNLIWNLPASRMVAPQDLSHNGCCSRFPRQNTNLLLNAMKFCVQFYERLTAPNVMQCPILLRLFAYASQWRRNNRFVWRLSGGMRKEGKCRKTTGWILTFCIKISSPSTDLSVHINASEQMCRWTLCTLSLSDTSNRNSQIFRTLLFHLQEEV